MDGEQVPTAELGHQEKSGPLSTSSTLSSEDQRNRLEYLADLIGELQALARECSGSTLQGLLLLAYSEAGHEVKRLESERQLSSVADEGAVQAAASKGGDRSGRSTPAAINKTAQDK